MTRRPKKRKGFCGNPPRSSTTSSDLDNSTVVGQRDEEHIEHIEHIGNSSCPKEETGDKRTVKTQTG